ncbi:MAG: DNA-processing protein DprA [Chromatiales bacterium]|nr:DNA-processing protein DprA [Chromatiales bacterium]
MPGKERERVAAWLRLWHAPGVGPATFARLLERFPDPLAALQAPVARLREAGLGDEALRALDDPMPAGVATDLDWAEGERHHLLTLDDPRYPPQLAAIDSAPPVLYVTGDADLLSLPQLAIVGSRHATPGGLDHAREFARYLAGSGLVITSGLALGIDGAAHRGALEGGGRSIAVVATGPDRVYPARHRGLAHELVREGAIVGEFPLGTPVRADQFPRRNRIISGLSLGVLVVEAAQTSGSLITARLAAEQGREVFAIPGSIQNPMARGCHRLIRQGAKLVETAADIVEELGALAGFLSEPGAVRPASPAAAQEMDADHQKLLAAMGYDPVTVDRLVERSGLTPEVVSSILLILELQGLVAAQGGGRYIRLEPRKSE